jgi:acyl carrier protein
MNILTTLQREIAIVCGVQPEQVQPTALLVEFGLDSVRSMDLIIGLEAEYDIEINDAEMIHLETVADVVGLVEAKMPAHHTPPVEIGS